MTDGQDRESTARSPATAVSPGAGFKVPVRLKAILAALPCLLAAVYLGLSAERAATVAQADRLISAGEERKAIDVARQVTSRPAAADALLAEAHALLRLEEYEPAARAFQRAAALERENWMIRRDWAVALAGAGERSRAAVQMSRALALNPGMPLPPGFVARSGAAEGGVGEAD